MTVNVHIGLVVGSERAGDVVQGGAEFRLDRIAVGIERDARWHVQKQLVALADDIDIGPGRLFAKILFLLVHIGADRRARDGPDPRATDHFGPLAIAADDHARPVPPRSEARRVRKECGSKCSFWGSRTPY